MSENYKTAIVRNQPSAPMQWLDKKGYLKGLKRLDYCCGRGYDSNYYGQDKFDPHWFPEYDFNQRFDLITCNYVLNVVTEEQQEIIIQHIANLLYIAGRAFFSVRRDLPIE